MYFASFQLFPYIFGNFHALAQLFSASLAREETEKRDSMLHSRCKFPEPLFVMPNNGNTHRRSTNTETNCSWFRMQRVQVTDTLRNPFLNPTKEIQPEKKFIIFCCLIFAKRSQLNSVMSALLLICVWEFPGVSRADKTQRSFRRSQFWEGRAYRCRDKQNV